MENCDDKVFGDWVYCRQHVRPHATGWCTVSNHDKIGLGIVGGETQENIKLAHEKCRDWKLPIYGEAKAVKRRYTLNELLSKVTPENRPSGERA